MDRIREHRRWTKRRLLWAGAILATAAFAALALSGGGGRLRVPAAQVSIATVESGLFRDYLPLTGTVVPRTSHCLEAIESGRVEEIFREAGSLVTAGEPILRLSNPALLLDALAREADLVRQASDLRAARQEIEERRLLDARERLDLDHEVERLERLAVRQSRLLTEGLLARQTCEETRAELAWLAARRALLSEHQARDSLYRAEQLRHLDDAQAQTLANLELVRRGRELSVRAPIDGRLTALDVQVGRILAPGERVGQVDRPDGFQVRAAAGEQHAARIVAGLRAGVEIEGRAHVLEVIKAYPEITNGRFELDLRFIEAEPAGLRRGQSVHVRLELSEPESALLLPAGPFLEESGGAWLFVLDPSGRRARRRPVTLGRRSAAVCEVLAGLSAGERVIVSSYELLGEARTLALTSGGGDRP